MNQHWIRAAGLVFVAMAGLADADEGTVNNEAEIRIQMDIKQELTTNICKAQVELEWYQKGSSVHVESEIGNETCGPSSGSLLFRVSYRGEDGEIKTADFPVADH